MPPILSLVLIAAAAIAYSVFVWRYFQRKKQKQKQIGVGTRSTATEVRTTAWPAAPPQMPLGPDGTPLTTAHQDPADFGARDTVQPERPPEAPPALSGPLPAHQAHPTTPVPTPDNHRDPQTAGMHSVSQVIDLVAGIRLPEELVPLVDVIPRPSVFDRVMFMTVDAPAERVQVGLAAALEAIGTEMRWDGDQRKALLRRDGHSGWVEIHSSPMGLVPLGTPKFPTLPDHTVIVEFWTDGTGEL